MPAKNAFPSFSGLSIRLAVRYFFGKKSAQAINIISWISVGAIAVSTAAMVILLSVENGFDGLLKELYKAFYPPLKVSPKAGKWLTVSEMQQQQLRQIPGIDMVAFSIEDHVLLSANEDQRFGTLKGVDAAWMQISGLDRYIVDGNATLEQQPDYIPAVIGVNIAAVLGINIQNPFSALSVYYPNPAGTASRNNPLNALNSALVKPQAVFKVQSDFDSKYVLIPLPAAQSLLGAGSNISSIAIKPKDGISEKELKKQLLHLFGNQVIVENQFEQNRTLWMIMRSEKWAIYVILLFVLLLSSFNMIGALSMLVMEKKKDITILKSMGATQRQIRDIFITEGLVMAFIGGITGVFFGAIICFSQQIFGWMKLGDGVFIIEAYPVKVMAGDMILVIVTALIIGLIAAWQPAQKAAMQKISIHEE